MQLLIWGIIFSVVIIWYVVGYIICCSPDSRSEIISNVRKGRVRDNKAPNTGERFDNSVMTRDYNAFIKKNTYKKIMDFVIDYDEE